MTDLGGADSRIPSLLTGPRNITGAHRVRAALRDLDPITAPASPDLIRVAILHAQLSTDPEEQLGWARYAYRACTTTTTTTASGTHAPGREAAIPGTDALFGPGGQLWFDAVTCYANVLSAQHLTFDAVRVRRHLVVAHTRRRELTAVIEQRRLLALALHADSQCDDAELESRDALQLWRTTCGTASRTGTDLLVTCVSILAGCGHLHEAIQMLRRHSDLLPYADSAEPGEAAQHIITVEDDHLPVCKRHRTARAPLGTGTPDERYESWRFVLSGRVPHHQRDRSAFFNAPYPAMRSNDTGRPATGRIR